MVGNTVAHFRIDAKLGEGGMGAVYRATDTRLHRPVALKFLSPKIAVDARARDLLMREARTASRLNHPAIATVYDVGEADGTPFIAMELVQGDSLKDLLAGGVLQPSELRTIAQQIAEGLSEAHKMGIFHRDIKPGNIMLDVMRRVKILDFGLAALTHHERGDEESEGEFVSRTATMLETGGTVPYMAPEQLRGEPADSRSDIFSFGVVLYEALGGRRPFEGETAVDVLHGILRLHHTPIRELVPDLPDEWDQIIERCLEKSPQLRPQSMDELLRALQRAAAPAARAAPRAPDSDPSSGSIPVSMESPQEKSLAVLYFEHLSSSEDDEYFRDGVTEDIIIELSKIEGLRVFPRSAAQAYRDKRMSAQDVGRELGAAYVLGGSIRRAGKRLRLTAQLVETRTGHSVWAERYDRQLEDVFEIQDEISQAIAKALQVMLTEKAASKAPTKDVRAYDFYLRGRQYFHEFRAQGFDYARQMFARAIVVDPTYALAYAGVADCCSFLYMYFDSSEANLEEADSASQTAINLEPELAEAHASRGLAVSLRKEYEEAAREFETAVRLNPKLFEAYYFHGRSSFAQGALEDAARLFKKASEVNPEDYQAPFLMAQTLKALHAPETDAAYRKTQKIVERYIDLHPDEPRALYLGASVLAYLGQKQRALDWINRALQLDPEDSGVLYNVACGYAELGETERAIDCLEASIQRGGAYKEWMDNDPSLDPVRTHPRYAALIELLERDDS